MIKRCLPKTGKFRLVFFLLLFCLVAAESGAQVADTRNNGAQARQSGIKIVGVISSQRGERLPGVTVNETGTKNFALSGETGEFAIHVLNRNAQLTFTFIGYKSITVPVGKKDIVDAVLQDSVTAMNEVIVVGFGTQKKASVVGAISTVKPSQLQLTPNRSISNNLAGMVPGIIAVQRSGDPWSSNSDFWIRGISTFGGNSRPLVLVDGVERSLNDIDPEEIESFSVLKDAAASAVYGVRGANGVIMINTKRGKMGPPQVSVRFERATTSLTQIPEYIGAVKYIELMNEIYQDAGRPAFKPDDILQKYRDQSDPELYPDVNWWKTVAKENASNMRANLNLNGGNNFLRYALEMGYFKEDGLIRRDTKQAWDSELKVDRYNVRSNVDLNVTPTTVLRVNLGGYLQTRNGPPGDANETNFGIFYQASRIPPYVHPAQYSNGALPRVDFRENPWAWATQRGYERWNIYQLQSTTAIEQDLKGITPGLKAKLTFAFDKFSGNSVRRSKDPDYYKPATGRNPDGSLALEIQSHGQQYLGFERNSQWGDQAVYLEGMVSYAKVLNEKHDINTMMLYNQRNYDRGDNLPYRNQGIAARFSYTYGRRYIAEFNFGYNGSENFERGKRFGFFPAAAVGWVVSQEKFMQPIRDIVSNLKFRGSWGKAGNSVLGQNMWDRRFAYISTIADFGYYRWGVDNDIYRLGRAEGDVGVPGLTWETVTKRDLGMELGLFKGAVNLNVDLFWESRKDIFMQRNNIPGSAGFLRPVWANFGKVENQGVELSLNVEKNFSKDWSVTAMANYTYAHNKRTEIDEPLAVLGTYRSATGTPVGQLFGLVSQGLFSEGDFDANGQLKPGIPNQTFSQVLRPGDIRYRDLNGDGVINELDKTAIGGTRMPQVIYGFGATIRYKLLDIGFFFQGAGKTWQLLGGENWMPGTALGATGNIYSNIDDRWTPKNPSQDVFWPRLTYGVNSNNEQASTWWLKDMSFLRLKNLEAGFTVPENWSRRISISNFRVFARATNILTLADFKLWDPELETTDGLKYPLTKSVSFGINVNFK
ncbi:SusC/RagA family TonB-linked outer membrane protein [Chitinophaga sp. 22620]|uniref:SusC/RagA family TonB-linked outer membrane protein n=1 Tax=Chitinophaga sp. 22620 TaxID=3453952 RepID=UPI003F873048